MPALERLCEVAVAGVSGLVAVIGEPAARVSELRVGIEAVPACELDGVAFKHGAEPPERATPLDSDGELCGQVVIIDSADKALKVAICPMRSFTEHEDPARVVTEVNFEVVCDTEVGHCVEPHSAGCAGRGSSPCHLAH